MKRLIIASSTLTILVLLMAGFYFLSKNHYFCSDGGIGGQTRDKEKVAKLLTKYPNAKGYSIESSCGWPDGSPTAGIKFYTSDSQEKVFDFYESIFTSQGQKIVSRDNNMICGRVCVDYDPKIEGSDSIYWWNVEIHF